MLAFCRTWFSTQKKVSFRIYIHLNSPGFLPLPKRVAHFAMKSWRTIPDLIWIKDEWSTNYFHWMTNCLPRLWLGLQEAKSDKVILMESFRNLPYVTQSSELLEIQPVYFKSSENLWVKNLVLTGRTTNFADFHLPLIQLTREKLSAKSAGSPFRQVYISRRIAPKRKVHNELEVELLVRKKKDTRSFTWRKALKEH